MLTLRQVFDYINGLAPFETQEPYDNAGMLIGDPDQTITGIHVAMDLTEAVADEAIAAGANLIVTHHPVMFSGRKSLLETDREGRLICRLIRHRIALIAAHTNLDRAPGGMNDTLARSIGLSDVTGEDFLRVGALPVPMTAKALADHIASALNTVVRVMGDESRLVTRVGMCSGAGSDEWRGAASMGAEAFLTGEVKHHVALDAADAGVVMLEAGHHATEEPGIFALGDALQNWINGLQYNVHVSKSGARAY